MKPRLAALGLAAVTLLAGCVQPTPTPGPTQTSTPSATASSPATPTPSATPTGVEAQITAQILAYVDWGNRALTDPTVPVNGAAKYLVDVDPDYLMTAVQQRINKFRDDGYKQTGYASMKVVTVTSGSDQPYQARTCTDSSAVVVTNAKGETIDAGPAHAAAIYTMVRGVDGLWRASRIEGVGTC